MPIGATELIIITAVVLLLFGGAWIPKLARRAGRTVKATEPARMQVAEVQAQYRRFDRMAGKATRAATKASRLF